MTELIQITTDDIPPLRQSTVDVMGCPEFYVESKIKGHEQPGGLESARGTQVHHVHAQYASWCATKGISQDLEAFDRFSRGVGHAAHKILVGMRDGLEIDHEHLLATELSMSLDDNFMPTDVVEAIEGTVGDSGDPAAYQGTLDALYVFRDQHRINIDDAKTHPRPFDPDTTLQGKMYSLFVFQHFPWVQEVRFRLIFVRYRNVFKEVTYTRQDLPAIIDVVRSARARQQMLHDDYDAERVIEAIPGSHCQYCSLLSNRKCPISEFNPAMQLSYQDRLKFALWYKAFSASNNKVLKEHVDATGRSVVLKDYNGKAYTFGPKESKSKVYPLFRGDGKKGLQVDHRGQPVMPILDLLFDEIHSSPEDIAWMANLSISGTKLKQYLGTKKRVLLDQAVSDAADEVTKIKMVVSKPLDSLPDEDEDEDEQEDEEEF
jgi:hypothetical protein